MEYCPACKRIDGSQSVLQFDIESTFLACKNCGYIQDEQGNILDDGSLEMQQKNEKETIPKKAP